MGFFITNVMMNVVAAASAAVLVCFLEDPNALAVTHPGLSYMHLESSVMCGGVPMMCMTVDRSIGRPRCRLVLTIVTHIRKKRLPLLLAGGLGAALPGYQLVVTP